jgi:lipopolysaccharide export system permease protein
MIVDMMENLDDFIDQKTNFEIIFKYYLYFFPQIIKLMTPIAVLLGTLFSMGRFSTNNEITAMKSGGMSLYQIMLPYIFAGVIISFSHLYFNGWLVPKAETIKLEIDKKYLKKGSANEQLVNIYFRDDPLTNVSMSYYDASDQKGTNVAVEYYSEEIKPKLLKRIEARTIIWNDKKKVWNAQTVIIRKYDNPDGKISLVSLDTFSLPLKITQDEIVELRKSTKEMTFNDLKSYINLLEKGGKDVRQQEIEYYGNYAFPFANLIVILFGVPFASIRKKGGIAIQISAALVTSFLYILFTKVSQTIGYYSMFDPVLTGWSANILFLIASLIVLFKTRT